LPMPNQPMVWLLIPLVVLGGVKVRREDFSGTRVVGGMLTLAVVSYYAVAVMLPYDLQEAMESFPRVQLHWWPSLVFLALMLMRWEGNGSPGEEHVR